MAQTSDRKIKDRISLGILIFFLIVGCTLELYWVWEVNYIETWAKEGDFLSQLHYTYAECDQDYIFAPFPYALESFHVFVTQVIYLWLIWAIFRQTNYRHVLQLAVSSYVAYSVLIYYWTRHVAGYNTMAAHTPYLFFMFYGANFPWLAGSVYMGADSAIEISRCFRERKELESRNA